MVSLITEGSPTGPDGRPFRRRRVLPVAVLMVVSAVIGVAVWVAVLSSGEDATTAVACNAPRESADAQPLGTRVDRSTLADAQPAALAATRVRVFNANGQGGEAADVAAELRDYGLASAPDVQVGNDPVYVDQNMQCQGQIRFGEAGEAAASTVALLAPCSELIRDERTDDTVDLALGTYFRELAPNADAQEVLRTLADAPVGAAPAQMDLDLLDAARQSRC